LDSQDGGAKPDAGLPPKPGGQLPNLPAEALLPAVSLLRPASSRGGGGGGGAGGVSGGSSGGGDGSKGGRKGGAQRSAHNAASTAGRAAAAAYALKTGDRETLEKLGLSYDELQQITDPLELTSKIVDAACGTQDSTIEEAEQRVVAADVAEWVLDQADKGALPSPQDIARKSIATVISEVVASETGDMIRKGEWSRETAAKVEQEVREAAEVLADKANLSVNGVTDNDFTHAIENGVETLRKIIGSKKK
jgi:hypothetical protein